MGERLRLGIVVPAFFYVPYWAGEERGFYRDAGLKVEITSFGGIDSVTKALKDGAIDVGIGSPEHVIHDVEAGGQLRMVGGNVNRLTHDLIAQPEIKRLEDHPFQGVSVGAGRCVAAFWLAWGAWSQGSALGYSTHSQ